MLNFIATDVYSLSLKMLKPEDIFASKGAAVKEDGKHLNGTLLQADGLGGELGKTGWCSADSYDETKR